MKNKILKKELTGKSV